MTRILCIGAILVAIAGCDEKKKPDEGSTAATAASSAAVAAMAASGAAAHASAAANQAMAAASAATAAAMAPAADPGASVDPTVVPDHDQHEARAMADIHKGNYKKEMESLEKDLR